MPFCRERRAAERIGRRRASSAFPRRPETVRVRPRLTPRPPSQVLSSTKSESSPCLLRTAKARRYSDPSTAALLPRSASCPPAYLADAGLIGYYRQSRVAPSLSSARSLFKLDQPALPRAPSTPLHGAADCESAMPPPAPIKLIVPAPRRSAGAPMPSLVLGKLASTSSTTRSHLRVPPLSPFRPPLTQPPPTLRLNSPRAVTTSVPTALPREILAPTASPPPHPPRRRCR